MLWLLCACRGVRGDVCISGTAESGCKGSVFFRICNTVGGNFVPDVRLYVDSAVKNVLLEPWYCWHLGRFLPEIGPRCAGNAVSLRERGGPRSTNTPKSPEVSPEPNPEPDHTQNPTIPRARLQPHPEPDHNHDHNQNPNQPGTRKLSWKCTGHLN